MRTKDQIVQPIGLCLAATRRGARRLSTTAGIFIVGSFLAAGCAEPSQRLNSPPQGHTARPSELQEQYVPMSDNALLADMTVSSVHFVPHQSELNSTGIRRLNRLASLMKIYGGALHYDGTEADEKLVNDRIKEVEGFLASAGVQREKFSVTRGIAGGEGMRADEALEVNTALKLGTENTPGDGHNSTQYSTARIPPAPASASGGAASSGGAGK